MPELVSVQMAEVSPWTSAATARSLGTSWSVVENEIALSDGVTANCACPAATCRAGVSFCAGSASGLRSSTSRPAFAYSPSAAAT